MINDNDDVLDAIKYVRHLAEIDPKFATKKLFSMKEDSIIKCRNIMQEINEYNSQVSTIKEVKRKNEINRKKGKLLEDLSETILKSTDMFETKRNLRDHTNEIDILIKPADYARITSVILPDYLQDTLLVECKNYNSKIDVNWVGKFFSLAKTHKVKLGIIFSYKEFKGKGEWSSSKGLTKKIFLSDNTAIININFDDINNILDKKCNIIELIEDKYDMLRNQVSYDQYISKHPAEE